MKLWSTEGTQERSFERFTVGNDYLLDQRLVPYDCAASEAHAEMLREIGVLDDDELAALRTALLEIAAAHLNGRFTIAPEEEDCHTAIENYLTGKCGDAAKKIHTGRSRNDQVLTALRLYERQALLQVQEKLQAYLEALDELVRQQGSVVFPGYTHMQRAMPAGVEMWAGSYAAAARDDLAMVQAVAALVDQSPLGTAAGFGVPGFPLDRKATARKLSFARVMENPLYAQLSRGRTEGTVLAACSQILLALNRLATDLILFSTREFGFVKLARSQTTGSSIMPHKKNPDVLELLRGKYHVVVGEEMKIKGITANLMSGYNRDVQLTKEPLFNGLDATLECLEVAASLLPGVSFDETRCKEAMTGELYATGRVYELVGRGVPFREAYRQVAGEWK